MTDHLPGWDAPELVSLADCDVKGGRPGNRVAVCDQRSSEWINWRRGCVTASAVHKIIGLKGKPSTSATRDTYLYEIAAERVTGTCGDHHVTQAMERGIEQEPKPRQWYAANVRPVTEVGFVFLDPDRREIGASPDGLCEDRGLEVKVLLSKNHCRMLCKMARADNEADVIDPEHRLQMQFGMWVTGLKLWDYVLYSPPVLNMPNKVVTIKADEALHAAFDEVVPAFCTEVCAAVKAIKGEL